MCRFLFTAFFFGLGLGLGWLTTDFNETHMEILLRHSPLYGPLLTIFGFWCVYWLSEKSKRRDRRLAILRTAYLEVWSDWAQFAVLLGNTSTSDPEKLMETMLKFVAAHARLQLVAPVKMLRGVSEIGALIREIYPPLMAWRKHILASNLNAIEAVDESLKLRAASFAAASKLRYAILEIGTQMRSDLEGDTSGGEYYRVIKEEADNLEKKLQEILKAEQENHRAFKDFIGHNS